MLVEGWLSRAACARPDAPALETPGGNWSYAQLHRAARSGAEQLVNAGADRGSRVAIALPAGLELAQALHACLLLGAVAVPVDLRLSAPERERIAAGCALLIEEPLDGRWLERAHRSSSAEPMWEPVYRQAPLAPATWEKLQQHPQFR